MSDSQENSGLPTPVNEICFPYQPEQSFPISKSEIDVCGTVKSDRSLVCKVCNKRFCHRSSLSRHQYVHKSVRPYICPVCNKGFTQKPHLKCHMLQHSEDRPYQCSLCNRRFLQERALNQHKNTHLKHSTVISDATSVSIDQPPDTMIKQDTESEDISLDQSNQSAELAFHNIDDTINRVLSEFNHECHQNEYNHQGGQLDLNFYSADHETYIKKEPECYPVDETEYVEPDNNVSDRLPEQSQHGLPFAFHDEEQFAPNPANFLSDLTFDLNQQITNESVSSFGSCSYISDPCVANTNNSVDANSPECTTTKKRSHSCNVCGKIFSHRSSLSRHKYEHRLNYTPFRCPYCNKAFKQKPHMKLHIYSHTQQYPYRCELCCRGFTSSSSLNKHQTSHLKDNSNLKLHTCALCCETFPTVNELKFHLQKHALENITMLRQALKTLHEIDASQIS